MLHAYGLVTSGDVVVMPSAGVLGAHVDRLGCGPYDAVVSRHPEQDLGAQVWEEGGQDPRWLAPVARDHHAVLQELVDQGDVLPLRLPGIYADETALRESVAASEQHVREAMSVIRGRVEWGVKVFARSEAPADAPTPAPASGADYLKMRSNEAAERVAQRDRRSAAVQTIHEELAGAASQAVVHPPRASSLSDRTEPMLLNASYLVSRGDQDRFLALCDRLAEEHDRHGLALEATGPWPPYSFTLVGSAEEVRT